MPQSLLCSSGCPETHYVAKAGREFEIHLPQTPECWQSHIQSLLVYPALL
jgi:hypothetical protein